MLPSQVAEVLRTRIEARAAVLVPPAPTLQPGDHRHALTDRLKRAKFPFGLSEANEDQILSHLSWSLYFPRSEPREQRRLSATQGCTTEVELLLLYEIRVSSQEADCDAAIDLVYQMNQALYDDGADGNVCVTNILQQHETVQVPAERLFMALRSRLTVQFDLEA
jgi:hypothetical protein